MNRNMLMVEGAAALALLTGTPGCAEQDAAPDKPPDAVALHLGTATTEQLGSTITGTSIVIVEAPPTTPTTLDTRPPARPPVTNAPTPPNAPQTTAPTPNIPATPQTPSTYASNPRFVFNALGGGDPLIQVYPGPRESPAHTRPLADISFTTGKTVTVECRVDDGRYVASHTELHESFRESTDWYKTTGGFFVTAVYGDLNPITLVPDNIRPCGPTEIPS